MADLLFMPGQESGKGCVCLCVGLCGWSGVHWHLSSVIANLSEAKGEMQGNHRGVEQLVLEY